MDVNDKQDNNINTNKEIVILIQQCFLAKHVDQSEITELIMNHILETENIYTIREDDTLEMWIYVKGIYKPEAQTYIKEWCRHLLEQKYSPQLVNKVIAKIEVESYIEKEDFFKVNNVNEIAVLNGILDIRTKILTTFTPEKIFFNKINAKFDKDATSEIIDNHFKNILASEKDIPVIEELFGFCLYRDYKIEKAFMLTGEGRNGKGKTVELLKIFLHPENCCNVSLKQIEQDSFCMCNFQNKMANIAADISSSSLEETGNFKQLTGHDMISANRKNRSYIHFVNYAKLIFCANELPKSSDNTNAFWNRWVLLKFPYTFISKKEYNCIEENEKELYKIANPEQIEKLTLPDQLSGLLNKALLGLNRLLDNKDFSYSK